jgi:hypothetical protein
MAFSRNLSRAYLRCSCRKHANFIFPRRCFFNQCLNCKSLTGNLPGFAVSGNCRFISSLNHIGPISSMINEDLALFSYRFSFCWGRSDYMYYRYLLQCLAVRVDFCPHHHLENLTYLPTPWCSVLEKLTGLQLVKKFPTFYGTGRFITALTGLCHPSLSWANPNQSICPHATSW